MKNLTTQNRRIIIIPLATLILLSLPLLAMQITDQVNWKPADFIVAGILLLGAGFTYEWLTSRRRTLKHRVVVGTAVAAVLLLIWVELAVGIFGTPFAGS